MQRWMLSSLKIVSWGEKLSSFWILLFQMLSCSGFIHFTHTTAKFICAAVNPTHITWAIAEVIYTTVSPAHFPLPISSICQPSSCIVWITPPTIWLAPLISNPLGPGRQSPKNSSECNRYWLCKYSSNFFLLAANNDDSSPAASYIYETVKPTLVMVHLWESIQFTIFGVVFSWCYYIHSDCDSQKIIAEQNTSCFTYQLSELFAYQPVATCWQTTPPHHVT